MHEIEISREKKGLGHRNAAPLIRKAAEAALKAEGIREACLISVMLTDDKGIRAVNREFRAWRAHKAPPGGRKERHGRCRGSCSGRVRFFHLRIRCRLSPSGQ